MGLLFYCPALPTPRMPTELAAVDGVKWKRTSLGDGSFSFEADCPTCFKRMGTGFLRVQPSAVHCKCGRWLKLP